MTHYFDVVVAGDICLDIIPPFKGSGIKEIGDIFVPGTLLNVGTLTFSTGGPVSNTGIALKILGNKVSFMAKIGNDEIGVLISDRLNKGGNTKGIKVVESESSSYTIVIAIPGIDRIFLHGTGANDSFRSSDVDYDIIAKARIFHFGYPPLMKAMYENEGRELIETFKNVKKLGGVITSLDMSLPDPNSPSGRANWQRILENLLPYVDIPLFSIEEAFFMLEKDEYLKLRQSIPGKDLIDFISPEQFSKLGDRLISLGSALAGLKCAHRGYYMRTAGRQRIKTLNGIIKQNTADWSNRELWSPAFRIDQIASATGSGDSSIAGFLSALLRGHSIEECLACANCVGYQNLHALDALSGIKTWQETAEMFQKGGLERKDSHIDAPGWQWDERLKVWNGPKDRK